MQGSTTTESYSYDPVGNRTASLGIPSYTTNSSNEMTANSNASYTYDSNGNTHTKTDSSGTTTYAWDYENRLTSVTLPGSAGTVSFKYDPFGRRIEKIAPTATSVFAYDGDNLIEEANGTGGEVASYTQTRNVDEPLAMDRSGTLDYYEQDGLGSVTSLTASNGSVAQSYTDDSFGNQTASSGSLTNFFRYTGREFDTETNLYFNRARYYDPATGRFLSEDPARLGGGGNFYLYASDEPTLLTDPSGLTSQDVQRIEAGCMADTQALTDAGLRYPGDGWFNARKDDTLVFLQYFGWPTHYLGCKSQAIIVKADLENSATPHDANWRFNLALVWGGTHTIVQAISSDPDDPIVLCDPWRNITWTAPAPQIPTGCK